MTLDEARKFYAQFYGASNAELVIVGQFDPAAKCKLAAELFGQWKSQPLLARDAALRQGGNDGTEN